MANILAPFGFRHVGTISGSMPNYAMAPRLILSSNGTAIFKGDPVTSLSSGYIGQSAPGTTQIHGIFDGCKYLSTSRGYTINQPYWPGSDAAQNPTADVINDPASLFLVQANAQALQSHVGQNANFALTNAGNTYSGLSGATLDISTVATTTTLPFRIWQLWNGPPGANGADTTTAYNYVLVTFNNQDFKSLTGI